MVLKSPLQTVESYVMRALSIIITSLSYLAVSVPILIAQPLKNDMPALCQSSGQSSENWKAQKYELTKVSLDDISTSDETKQHAYESHVSQDGKQVTYVAKSIQAKGMQSVYGRLINKNPFIILTIPDLSSYSWYDLSSYSWRGGLNGFLDNPGPFFDSGPNKNYAVPENEAIKLENAHFGSIIEGVDTRQITFPECGVGSERTTPIPTPDIPPGYSSKPPLTNLRIVDPDEHQKKIQSRSRLERAIASGILFAFHWNIKDEVGKYLLIFGDETALAISTKLATFVFAKPQQKLLEDLFRTLHSTELEHAQNDWTPLHQGIFMTLLCARAQRISLLDNESLRSVIEPKVQELFSSLVDDLPPLIHYAESLPIKIIDWPSDLPTLAEIFRPKDQQTRLKIAQTNLSKELWAQIPESESGPIGVNYDIWEITGMPDIVRESGPIGVNYDPYNKRVFFRDANGTFEVERSRCTPSGSYCRPQTAGALRVENLAVTNRVIPQSTYRFWPRDVEINLEVTKTKKIVIPENVLSNHAAFFQNLSVSATAGAWISGNHLFKGVGVYRRSIAD